jgi:hypothetical protein
MPREAGLFEKSDGSVVKAFHILRQNGGNIPPNWIDRSSASRKSRQKELGTLLRSKSIDAVPLLEDWELSYQKECFYYGLRVLLELERKGKSKL